MSQLTAKPANRTIMKHIKTVIIILSALVVLLSGIGFLLIKFHPFFALQAEGLRNAGTWEDDPKNWYRAFHEEPPDEVKVIHSKYWRSDHFTLELAYYFEVAASPAWRDSYLAKRNLKLVASETAQNYRTSNSDEMTPVWFAPNSVARYDVWDEPGGFGSVWVDKTNGHVFFYGMQL